MFRLTTGFSVFLAAALALGGCGLHASGTASQTADTSKELRVLTIGTADSGGTMYPVGKAVAQVFEEADASIKINLSASNGSSANVRDLESGNIDLGLVSGDIAFAAVNGTGEFKDAPVKDLRVIGAVYPSLSNWMALSDSGLSYVHDLRGKRIGIGPQDSTTELSAKNVLQSMRITNVNSVFENCGLGSGAKQVQEKSLDAIHGFTGVPILGLSELAGAVPCTVLRYTEKELTTIIRSNSFYYKDVIPAGTYKGQDEEVPTFGIKCLLCVSADMDEDLVHELTAILYGHRDQLKELHDALSAVGRGGFMYEELPIELHPGARRFYEEEGLLPKG